MRVFNNPNGTPFQKPALTVDEQIALLKTRGMTFDNEETAKHYLEFISYYRLSIYMLPFQTGDNSEKRHYFKTPITFEQIMRLYSFDRKLRLLSMNALERIEIALRSTMTNVLTEQKGSFWLTDIDNFHDKNPHNTYQKMLEEIEKEINRQSSAPCIDHYYKTYSTPKIPPSWMIFEILPFGCISRIYENLKRPLRKAVAQKFNLEESFLQSVFHSLSVLRNFCAHHSRIWNRTFPLSVKRQECFPQLQTAKKYYLQALILNIMLNRIVQTPTWTEKLASLLKEYADIVSPEQMGFPDNWQDDFKA